MLQTELHRHLDVCTRTETLLEIAQRLGIEGQSTSLEAFRDQYTFNEPFHSLTAVLEKFGIYQKVLDRPESFERIAFEATEDCYREGTRIVEFRYSPSFACEVSGLPWIEGHEAFERGIEKAIDLYPEMKVGLICIASKEFGIDAVAKTAEFYASHSERFIGFDIAGPEDQYPCHLYKDAILPVIEATPDRITIHAGEAGGPENIWEAIELLKASRIGHGVRCIDDPKLMQFLASEKICLEVCPTSNWITQATQKIEDHPLPQILRSGISVSINTDDPGIFNTTLPREVEICRKTLGLSEEEIQHCFENAYYASFLKNGFQSQKNIQKSLPKNHSGNEH